MLESALRNRRAANLFDCELVSVHLYFQNFIVASVHNHSARGKLLGEFVVRRPRDKCDKMPIPIRISRLFYLHANKFMSYGFGQPPVRDDCAPCSDPSVVLEEFSDILYKLIRGFYRRKMPNIRLKAAKL